MGWCERVLRSGVTPLRLLSALPIRVKAPLNLLPILFDESLVEIVYSIDEADFHCHRAESPFSP